jgi:quercetin dioxygenase-like cupin family protein
MALEGSVAGESGVRAIFFLLAAFAATFASAQPYSAEWSKPAARPEKMVTTPILRTRLTSSNQPLKLPQGEAELVAIAVDIPAGGATSIHQHPWSRFAYVEKGELRVLNHDTGEARDFKSGEVLSEAVGQWHEGRATSGPVRLIVFDLVPPGATNTVARPLKEK